MDDTYEREWIAPVTDPTRRTRLRIGITTERGTPVRFLVQLEYYYEHEWRQVARFDHDRYGKAYLDVRQHGLHLDVYAPDGTQIDKQQDFSPVDETTAISDAEQYLKRHYDHYSRGSNNDDRSGDQRRHSPNPE